MRWQLAGDWPVGQFSIPAGTVLSSGAGEAPIWNGVALPMPPPLNAVPLDAEAALLMLRSYDESLWHRLVFVHDLDRAAVIARAVHERRWPNGEPVPAMAESPLAANSPSR